MKVLVTGASGFLGRAVVDELLRRGHTVRAQVRPASRIEGLGWEGKGVEIVRADLRARTDLVPAFDGIDVLIHLAAAVTGGEDLQFASTVVGTERLLEAMQKSQTKTIVLASSFSVYDWRRVGTELTEDSPLEADIYERDGYAIAKFWQELLVRRMSRENGWRLVVLRPGFIWGRDNAELAGLGQPAGPAYLVISPKSELPLTHVENCAHAFVTAAEMADVADGKTFNIVDGHAITTWQYAGRYLRARSRGTRVPVPYRLGLGLAHVAERASKLMFRGKGKLPGILMPIRFRARFRPVKCGNIRLRETLGWSPPLSLDECLSRTFDPPHERAPVTAPTSPGPARADAGA